MLRTTLQPVLRMRIPDFQQLQLNRVTLRAGEFGAAEGKTPERVHQKKGGRRKPEPQLIRLHGGRGGAVGEEVQLLLLDTARHFPAGTVNVDG